MTKHIYDRIAAIGTALTVLIVIASTNVGLTLWFIDGYLAEIFGFLYVSGLLYLAIKPNLIKIHKFVGAVGLVFWVSRGLAFVDFIYQSRLSEPGVRWDLLGAVAERLFIVLLVCLIWHLRSIERIVFFETISLGQDGRDSDY